MSIAVMRYKRNKIATDKSSPELYYLKPVPGHTRTYSIEDVAREIEVTGGLSAEDVGHTMKSFVRCLRMILTRGDKVKVDGLGTFHVSFNCKGTAEEKDCTVRNIRKVNIRFAVDNTLRLVNDSIASTRGGANNIEFYINGNVQANKGIPEENPSGGEGNSGGGQVDPDA